jgi:hypothetical protein
MTDGGRAHARRTSTLVRAAAVVVAASCAGCGFGPGAAGDTPPLPSAEANPAPRVGRSVRQEIRSLSFTAGCSLARPGPTDEPMTPPDPRTDLHLGPLWYGGRPPYQLPDPPPGGPDPAGTFVKTGAVLPAGASATITVDPPQRGRVGIVVETGRRSGYTTVHYVGCPDRTVWWVGGFVIADARPVCLPVTVRDDRRNTAAHYRIGLGRRC